MKSRERKVSNENVNNGEIWRTGGGSVTFERARGVTEDKMGRKARRKSEEKEKKEKGLQNRSLDSLCPQRRG